MIHCSIRRVRLVVCVVIVGVGGIAMQCGIEIDEKVVAFEFSNSAFWIHRFFVEYVLGQRRLPFAMFLMDWRRINLNFVDEVVLPTR